MILKVRDFASSVPRDFGPAWRERVLSTCLADGFFSERAIDKEKREATFVLTDPSLDSYGEIIDAGAFNKSLPGYMRNPAVLAEHRHYLWGSHAYAGVGSLRRIFNQGDALLGTIHFGTGAAGEERWRAVLEGSLRAVSVGFRPVNTRRDPEGVLHYTEAILKEVSTCPVAANDNALLVNSYVVGQAELLAPMTTDPHKMAEFMVAASELQATVEKLRAELAELRGGDEARLDALRREGNNGDNGAFRAASAATDAFKSGRELLHAGSG